jgi:hypothetical protein
MPVFEGEPTINSFYPLKHNDFRFTNSAVPLRDTGLPGAGNLGSANRSQSDPTMRIKKLTDGSVLERGQLLVVLHCLNRCGSDALFDLRKSIRTAL